jgi:hypothetical protein
MVGVRVGRWKWEVLMIADFNEPLKGLMVSCKETKV